MGKRSEHGQIQTRRKREEVAAWEEVRGSLVSNPDVGEMEGFWIQMQKRVLGSRSRKDMEGAWIQIQKGYGGCLDQTQKRIWRVLGSRCRRGYGGCLDPDTEEDMEGAWIQMQKRMQGAWIQLGYHKEQICFLVFKLRKL